MSFSESDVSPEKSEVSDDHSSAQKDLGVYDMPPEKEAFLREMLVRVADKWTLLVIDALDVNGEMRFTRLQECVVGVSQKMLTKTLRQLERDGLVTRNVHAIVPPRVDYKLTPLGDSLAESVCGICTWADQNMQRVANSRQEFDDRK